MKNDNTRANQRGSSPATQDPEQDFYRWLNGLKSIGQLDEKDSAAKIGSQAGRRGTDCTGQKDESRPHDDGGDGGGVV